MNSLSLVADIGGTNTRVALAKGHDVQTETIERFRNSGFSGLEQVLETYLGRIGGVKLDAACVAVAGPVRNGAAALTNLDWEIDEIRLARVTNAPVNKVFNDLRAQGYALDHISGDGIGTVINAQTRTDDESAKRLVIGVGTGFNIAPVYRFGSTTHVAASECGHAGLPAGDGTDLDLYRHVSESHRYPVIEDILSGPGLERIYRFIGETEKQPQKKSAAEIMAGCARGDDSRALETARTFSRILGEVCGDQALIHLPFGGIFLVGGVARAFAPHLVNLGFSSAFTDKGRFSDFMENFPVHVIEDDYAALTGCAAFVEAILLNEQALGRTGLRTR